MYYFKVKSLTKFNIYITLDNTTVHTSYKSNGDSKMIESWSIFSSISLSRASTCWTILDELKRKFEANTIKIKLTLIKLKEERLYFLYLKTEEFI